MTFDLKINLGHSDLYFMVQWFLSFIFSGELRCPATAVIEKNKQKNYVFLF